MNIVGAEKMTKVLSNICKEIVECKQNEQRQHVMMNECFELVECLTKLKYNKFNWEEGASFYLTSVLESLSFLINDSTISDNDKSIVTNLILSLMANTESLSDGILSGKQLPSVLCSIGNRIGSDKFDFYLYDSFELTINMESFNADSIGMMGAEFLPELVLQTKSLCSAPKIIVESKTSLFDERFLVSLELISKHIIKFVQKQNDVRNIQETFRKQTIPTLGKILKKNRLIIQQIWFNTLYDDCQEFLNRQSFVEIPAKESWSFQNIVQMNCNCPICHIVNEFLLDPIQQEVEINISRQYKNSHNIEELLNPKSVCCICYYPYNLLRIAETITNVQYCQQQRQICLELKQELMNINDDI
ncbi:unnamed protein product [Didymodactylos carnosus]|uniref:Uncharacterized protein n=1 Tax=Didymodactylos carnosus TaxID=1234261 RepID=A0A814XYR6_9BILA|nr:unnamed protein product [Didymodactylos carnosus]CAF1222704.1 unnamed protein product [Didymodactylos carnosus]CAF3798220.1 unnamed protein product [Didymodactylos carnosus]CAF3985974.1 unnamed protein product [Didymodactylos carnosus]